jgi:signal transduction histidine kinase
MSLRTRLIVSHTLIVILCLSIAAVAVSVLLQGYRDRIAMTRLDYVTRPIFVQVRSLARGQASITEVWENLQEQAQKNDVSILLVDSKGNITRQASPQENQQQSIDLAPEEVPHGISQPKQGTFTTTSGQTFIYAAYPLGRLSGSRELSRLDTLVLTVPHGGPLAIWASLVRPFLQAGLIALGASVIIAILLARSVYRPVQRVTEAAERIAQGQYDQGIPVTGPKEVKVLAIRFNEMANKVKQSQHQLRHFVADVSHQLKSPLTSIQGFAQAILDGTADDSDTRLKAARVINVESKRMIRQVDELLELSRMQSGQIKMAQEIVDIKELLLHCQEIFAMRAEETGTLLRMDIEPLMPVVGDIDRLEHVFSNLLDNALKNSPVKGEVHITGRKVASSIEITVADHGPGIPPEQLPYVFERFYQASGLRTGVGLGLAIAKEIVLAHGGKIEAVSNPGEGAVFIVKLPASGSKSS